MTTKIKSITEDTIKFDNGYELSFYHEQDCCENHYLDFTHIEPSDYEGLEFDLSGDNFFERLPGFGIALLPTNNYPLRIPGYADNNGYYNSELRLELQTPDKRVIYDITDCQDWRD